MKNNDDAEMPQAVSIVWPIQNCGLDAFMSADKKQRSRDSVAGHRF
jgi:hypothetical protein